MRHVSHPQRCHTHIDSLYARILGLCECVQMLTRSLKLCMKTVGNAYGVHMLPPPHTHITMGRQTAWPGSSAAQLSSNRSLASTAYNSHWCSLRLNSRPPGGSLGPHLFCKAWLTCLLISANRCSCRDWLGFYLQLP